MPRIADYAIAPETDKPFILQTGGDIDFIGSFNVDSGVARRDLSILAFMYSVTGAVNNLRFQGIINGTPQVEILVTGPQFFVASHEVIKDVLQPGSNQIEFRITHGSGTLRSAMSLSFTIAMFRSSMGD